MCKPLFFLLLFCASLPALASDSNEHWLEAKSPHFVVLTDSNEKQARRIAGQFEQMRAVFHTILPTASDDAGAPIIVLALKDRKALQSLEPAAYLGKNQLDLAGLFINAQDKHYILLRLDAQGEHPFYTVYHEYTHYMLRKATWLPLWLNEGLAEFYQNTDLRDKYALLGQPSGDYINYLRENRLLPLTTLLKVDYTSPFYHEEQRSNIFYGESWALTHYIIVTDHTKSTNRLADYIRALARQEDPVTAAQSAFGDLTKLQSELDGYIRQGSFSMFKMNVAIPVDPASFEVRPVSNAEADAIRGDVLINTGRHKDAEALLEASLREDPGNALAHEAMGTLKMREGDIAAAQKWYGEAVQLDSQSYLAQYYFAAMSMQRGNRDEDAAIESSLRAAIKLNPAWAYSYDALANFYASRDRNLGEAHLLNIQAVTLDPANLNFRLNAANVLSQQRLNQGAIGVLKAALPVARTPEDIALVQRRIHELEVFQAQMDRAAKQTGEAAATSSGSQPKAVSMETASSHPSNGPSKTMVFRRVDGKVMGTSEEMPTYPTGDATGPKHTIAGVLRDVRCSYPNVLSLSVEHAGKSVTLYTNNYYKVVFTTANYEPDGDIKPCIGIEDMKASVKYAEVSDKSVAGQILAIELSK